MSIQKAIIIAGLIFGFGERMEAWAGDDEIAVAIVGIMGCANLKDNAERLACFDKNAAAAKAAAGLPTQSVETATTKDMVENYAASDFKVVDPDDIHVAPRKYLGKPIEVRNVRCFYADKDDYRCISPTTMSTVFFVKSVSPEKAKDDLEADCGAIRKIAAPSCRKAIRIVPIDYSEDSPSAFAKRIIIRSKNIEIVEETKRRRR